MLQCGTVYFEGGCLGLNPESRDSSVVSDRSLSHRCRPIEHQSSQAQSRQIKLQPAQVYTNEPSQFQFPPTVAEFQRESTFTHYDGEGRDIGVGYNDLLHSVAAT